MPFNDFIMKLFNNFDVIELSNVVCYYTERVFRGNIMEETIWGERRGLLFECCGWGQKMGKGNKDGLGQRIILR